MPDSMSSNGGAKEDRCNELMLVLRKYLLLVAILVATVTYSAGLNPPGGVWLDTQGGHLTGNQILVVTYHARYNAFSYSNATAFMASAVVILLLVFGFKDKPHSCNKARLFVVLRVVMVLDLLALVVAYAAGASRDMLTTVLASLLMSPILGLVMRGSFLFRAGEDVRCSSCRATCSEEEREEKRRRKILMLLAIFATSITYTAGLNPPGGFWPDTDTQGQEEQDDGHRAGDPVLQHHHRLRFAFFFICNTISFVASLFVIMLLLTTNRRFIKFPVVISLLGLVGAYAAGSCRETDSTAAVLVLYVLGTVLALGCFAWARQRGNRSEEQEEVKTPQTRTTKKKVEDGQQRGLINTAPSLVLLLATLAATVTYQAGLNPPGGFWPDHRDGHKGGDPILLSKHAARYRLFFYCNSTPLAASLVVIFVVLRNYLSTRSIKNNGSVRDADEHKPTKGRCIGAHVVILEVVMILDLIGLIGAFTAGCCRDVSTSIHVVALAGGALVYVVFHIVFFTLADDDLHHKGEGDDMEETRKLLLLLAIFAVTLTYQAGLTPPGGFWLGDVSEVGHHAGDPVLLSNYPRRYTAFFYLNATGFMASVAHTILLVNPNLYRAGIKCRALHVCMVAALFGLMGAYAAGSSRHVRTSIYMIALIGGLVVTFVTVLLLVFIIKPNWIQKSLSEACGCTGQAATIDKQQSLGSIEAGNNATLHALEETGEGTADKEAAVSSSSSTEEAGGNNSTANKEPSSSQSSSTEQEAGGGIGLHTQRRYLMLLGILAASVTYQAGLAPPGGVWPDNNDGHAVGNPILRDSSHRRYHMFFYCNSASFVASVVVIALQLLVDLTPPKEKSYKAKFLVQTAQRMMVLELVCLLLAYAAGSTR